MLEYDNSAFYYFGISLGSLYVIPLTYLSLKRIIYGVFLKDKLLNQLDVRCDKELQKVRQLQAEKTSLRKIFNPAFVVNLIILAVMWYGLYTMIMLVKDDSEIKTFDPFAILGISAGASDQEIKRAYRKMSLLYHPDKNPGDSVAESKFVLVAKANQALTDPVAKKNYEMFGNPDGRQSLQLSIGLPTFLLEKDNHMAILTIYLLVLVVAIPSAVALWYSHSKQYGDSMIMYDSYGFYNYALSENAHLKMMPEILAGSAEFREIPVRNTDQAELGTIFRDLKNDQSMAKARFNHPSIAKSNLLFHAHMMRKPLSEALKSDLDQMLKKSMHLSDGMMEICVSKGWLQTIINVIEFQQHITQALWVKDSPLLQLPHFTENEVKHTMTGKNAIRTLQQFINTPEEDRRGMKNMSEEEKAEVNRVCSILPNIDMDITVEVEDEDQIAEGDIMTVTVKLTRKNVEEGDTCDLVYAPEFPFPKAERWYIVVGDSRSNHLHAFTKVTSQEQVIEEKLRLQAPPKEGQYQLDIWLKSDSYLGLDQRRAMRFQVVSADSLPAFKPHPEDVELDNEPTLFQQVMNMQNEDSSDSEDEDDDDKKTK
ncbi:translocation protein SEC63 [Thraustotheca clavata]|uniref:Translocation protein SEC63 n=1 Tax=Thraustotheca clavata TaxID=74557 RepID=A0A1V9ZXA5_9STRA|nr:translocation protein SEC63 [Thraustotheca clavata]